MSRLKTMARFDERIDEPSEFGRCDHCGGEIYDGDYIAETTEGDVLHDDCVDEFLESIYVDRRYYAGKE